MSLRGQLLVALVVPACLVMAFVIWLADVSAQASLEDALGRRLVSVAHGAASVVPSRITRVRAGDDDARVVRAAERKLSVLARASGVPRIVIVDLDDATVLVDSATERRVREPYLRGGADAYELELVRSGTAPASVLFEGPSGQPFKTGYAPIIEEGIPVAAAAAMAPTDYQNALVELRARFLGASLVGLAILIVLALGVARWISVPLARIAQAASAISEGALDTRVRVEGPAEAQLLGASMNRMTEALKARDTQLQMMLAGIAHEVRNPLGGIELFGGLLQEDIPEGDPRREHVTRILSELHTLSRVVNDFLEYARERPPSIAPHSAAELLADAWAVAGVRNGAVEQGRDATISIDAERLRAALVNLLANAVQAAGDREVRARFELDAPWARFVIEDAGPGIPADKRSQIFEPFFTTKQRGTGLGLALVAKTVREHRGTIAVDDSPLGGARFIVQLPLDGV